MTVKYNEFLATISRMVGLDPAVARAAAEATLTALARTLPEPDRSRLLDALPGELTDDFPTDREPRDWDQRGFVRAVSLLSRRPLEQARVRAHAVLAALAEHEPELVADLRLPSDLRGLFEPPNAGGGIYGPAGHAAPLTAGEVRAALVRLPEWTGDTRGLKRTIALPAENLDRVLERIRVLRANLGRGPLVRRGKGRETDTAELLVRTATVDAVTALDVELAGRLDATIADAGAGMAAPRESE